MLVRYEVEYWDDYENKDSTDKGLTAGQTLGEAVDQVVNFYGNKVHTIKVYECENVLCDEELQDFNT